ncbi:hypothetical protein BS50DRAFT_286829 [Corynespora cassiicola Philippines]|uniref:Uncharacterized protein n=1 Tax=Corynespora cassiicola Philippines TaxID=1448308 RepID=A0A2T2P1N8_CORCC|nr:hypothetical protein BS50DRAFT_286829 [Corynespora cassiicola Philippines]
MTLKKARTPSVCRANKGTAAKKTMQSNSPPTVSRRVLRSEAKSLKRGLASPSQDDDVDMSSIQPFRKKTMVKRVIRGANRERRRSHNGPGSGSDVGLRMPFEIGKISEEVQRTSPGIPSMASADTNPVPPLLRTSRTPSPKRDTTSPLVPDNSLKMASHGFGAYSSAVAVRSWGSRVFPSRTWASWAKEDMETIDGPDPVSDVKPDAKEAPGIKSSAPEQCVNAHKPESTEEGAAKADAVTGQKDGQGYNLNVPEFVSPPASLVPSKASVDQYDDIKTNSSFEEKLVIRSSTQYLELQGPRTLKCTEALPEDVEEAIEKSKAILRLWVESSDSLEAMMNRLERMVGTQSEKKTGRLSPRECALKLLKHLEDAKEGRVETGEPQVLVEHEIMWAEWLVFVTKAKVMHLKTKGCNCRPEWLAGRRPRYDGDRVKFEDESSSELEWSEPAGYQTPRPLPGLFSEYD